MMRERLQTIAAAFMGRDNMGLAAACDRFEKSHRGARAGIP